MLPGIERIDTAWAPTQLVSTCLVLVLAQRRQDIGWDDRAVQKEARRDLGRDRDSRCILES